MSIENPTPTPEKEPRWLSLEEIKSELSRLRAKESFKAVSEVERTKENEKGVQLYEVVATDEKGDTAIYIYQKMGYVSSDLGISKRAEARSTVITVAYFKGDPANTDYQGGWQLSDYDDTTGKWTDTD
jgi:hypothetical protein